MQLVDWLDDLCVRFIINLPREELESVERICFQVEEAQWFYEDFIRPLDPALPTLNLQTFALRIFQHCPLLSQWSHYHHMTAFQEFLAYKKRVPVRGAIMLNEAMDSVVLVKGWKKGASWSFPRGKINKDEKDLDCAVREVYEETGFDIRAAGLVDEDNTKHIDFTIREQDMRLFVFRGVPEDTEFEPKTRKEISKIEWYKLTDLPTMKKAKNQHDGNPENLATNSNRFYMVAPFLHSLKKWIGQQKKLDAARYSNTANVHVEHQQQAQQAAQAPLALPEQLVANIPSDLPEVSFSNQQQENASAHLKRLLNINNTSMANTFGDPQSATPAAPAPSQQNTLLGLFRNIEAPSLSQAPPFASQLPQTPMDQVMQPPSQIPRPPHHQHSHMQPQQQFTAPPQFPNMPQMPPQAQNGGYFPAQNMPNAAFPSQSQTMSSLPKQQNTLLSLFQSGSVRGTPSAPQAPAQLGQSQQSLPPAPFRRTGDPDFVQDTRSSEQQGPVIPPANKLPPLKLNNHTLSLLNSFKGAAGSNASPKPEHSSLPPQLQPTQPQPFNSGLAAASHTQQQQQQPPPHTNALPEKGAQRNALLDLFRQPSGSFASAPQSQPSELAAAISPTRISHNLEASNHNSNLPAKPSAPAPGQIKVLQREPSRQAQVQGSSIADAARTSATVAGPLGTPNFGHGQRQGSPRKDAGSNAQNSRKHPRARNGTDTEGVSSANEGPAPASMQKVKILSRPGGSRAAESKAPVQSAPMHKTRGKSQRQRIDNPLHAPASAQTKAPFQPQQILKRPGPDSPQKQASSDTVVPPEPSLVAAATSAPEAVNIASENSPSVSSPAASILTSPPPKATAALPIHSPPQSAGPQTLFSTSFDRRSSQTETNKAALLSLFGKSPATAGSVGSVFGTPPATGTDPFSPPQNHTSPSPDAHALSRLSISGTISPPTTTHHNSKDKNNSQDSRRSFAVSPIDEGSSSNIEMNKTATPLSLPASNLSAALASVKEGVEEKERVVSPPQATVPVQQQQQQQPAVNRDRAFLLGYLKGVTGK